MQEGYTWATCSKVIQAQVKTLQTELSNLYSQNLLGISLHGSLALGGFQLRRSDIDVRVVTSRGSAWRQSVLALPCSCVFGGTQDATSGEENLADEAVLNPFHLWKSRAKADVGTSVSACCGQSTPMMWREPWPTRTKEKEIS